MHLVYVNQVAADEPSGQGSRELGFITALIETRPEHVSVVTPRRKGPVFSSPRIVEVPMLSKGFGSYAWYQMALAARLTLEARRHRGVVFHARYGPAMIAPLLVSAALHVPLTVRSGPTAHHFDDRRPTWLLRKLITLVCHWTMRRSAIIITATQQIRRGLIADHDLDPRKVRVVPNGVDLRKFIYDPNSGDPNLLGYVGTVDWTSGLGLVVETAPEILRTHPHARFVIVGGGPLLDSLRKAVAARNLDPYFEFTGPVSHDHVPAHISRCGVMLANIPGAALEQRGSSAMKLYEYLACGKPVIASRHPDHEFIERNGVGILHEPDDGAGMAGAIRTALDLSAASRSRIGIAARSVVEANYSWPRIAEAIVRLCEGCEGK